MAEALVSTFGRQIDQIVLIPSSGGRHEVTINGELVHSKAATKQHPDIDAVVEEVRRQLTVDD